MDKRHQTILFIIANEMKRSLENPVIFLTQVDYSDQVFNTLVEVHRSLLEATTAAVNLDIITDMYVNWLKDVKELETFKDRINTTPRETIYKAVETTIQRIKNKKFFFKKYLEGHDDELKQKEKTFLRADAEIIGDMQESVVSILHEKLTCFQYQADQTEFLVKVEFELEELLNWLDEIYNNLTIQLCGVLKTQDPNLCIDLANTLHQFIQEIANSQEPSIQKIYSKIDAKMTTEPRFGGGHDLEIKKVVEKIKGLASKIERLQDQHSSAVMALEHKKMYLEERLLSLEKLQDNVQEIKMKHDEAQYSRKNCFVDHLLPESDRARLVEELLVLWSSALSCHSYKSMISIMSVADGKEVYTDDFGNFKVDLHGRKIYVRDGVSYQVNERSQLVEVCDDEQHIYYYDDCGRYYINEKRQHIYKRPFGSSEYVMYPPGILYKYKEVIDGIEYRYDNIGRYYTREEDGTRVYKDIDAESEYEYDDLGNLVRLRDDDFFVRYVPTLQPINVVTDESKYLQKTVGTALKECIADVILHQPKDPIGFLAEKLVKYRKNIEDREIRLRDEVEMMEERERIRLEEEMLRKQALIPADDICIEEGSSYDSAYSYKTK